MWSWPGIGRTSVTITNDGTVSHAPWHDNPGQPIPTANTAALDHDGEA